jgi:preprotein translocase subunit SecD
MNRRKTSVYVVVALFVATLAAGMFVYPGSWADGLRPWRQGLELEGGTKLVYEVDLREVKSEDHDSVMGGLRDIVEQRVNLFGVSEPQVRTIKEGESSRLLVELAGIKDPAQAINQIGRTALLEFREVGSIEGEKITYVATNLTGRYLQSAQVVTSETTNQPQIAIQFNDEGSKLFEDLTAKNVGKPIAIFIDGQLVSQPVVQAKIPGGEAVITGQFTFDGAKQLANLLNAGALPAPMTLLHQDTVSASLGSESLNKAILAGIVGTIAVILFMMGYYRALGFFASVALIIYIVLTLSIFKAVPITMTLSGIAGFILSIGMAVDANVLIFERVKEEMRRGLSYSTALEEGFRRSWPSIRDSNISTIITSLILFYSTSSFVKGFAVALLIGVLVSMFSAITLTRALLRAFLSSKEMKKATL